MKNEIQTFKNDLFGQVRTILINGEPWFVGKDIAQALGYSNTKDALSKHVDDEDKTKGVAFCDPIGRQQYPTIINESGLYSLILSSKLKEAKRFKRWITKEVMPTIRKTGTFSLSAPSYQIEDPIKRAQKWIEKEQERQRLESDNASKQKLIEEQKPKVDFANAITASKGAIPINDFAKIIAQNGIEIGVNRLYKYLRNIEYLGLRGKYRNKPYQQYIDGGIFEIEEDEFEGWINTSVFVTSKEQNVILQKILKDKADNTLTRKLR